MATVKPKVFDPNHVRDFARDAADEAVKYTFGEIEKMEKSEKLVMSGYGSTGSVDLVNEVIVPSAWEKHLWRYQKNPVYCWQHDRNIPIGKIAGDIVIDNKGLYFNDITLSDIPIVREFIRPLVEDGVLKQQSVGFIPIDGAYDRVSKQYVHTEAYLLELSLVTVACNPDSEIDTFVKSFGFNEKFSDLDSLIRAYHMGIITENDRTRSFVVDGLKNNMTNQDDATPTEVKGILGVSMTDEDFAKLDVSEEINTISTPAKYNKRYDELSKLIFAGKDGSGYVLQIGNLTTKGFIYDWDLVAIAMAKLLGAKGSPEIASSEKMIILERLAQAYAVLGKDMPVYSDDIIKTDTPLNDLTEDVVQEIKFKDVTFRENENLIFEKYVFDNDVKSVVTTLESWKSKGLIDDEFRESFKSVYASLYISVYGYDDESMEEMLEILEQIVNGTGSDGFKEVEEAEEKTDEPQQDVTVEELIKAIKEMKNGVKPVDHSDVLDALKNFFEN